MNNFAYRTSKYALRALSGLSKTQIRIHGKENIPPKGAIIYAINHFTRIETLFIPYHINRITGKPIWSLADYNLFRGGLGEYLDKVGAVSTKDPNRDLLIVKSLLIGEASWVIFPEGRMVKNKKIYERKGRKRGEFIISSPDGRRPPHTGTATLALRTAFYRERLRRMINVSPREAERLIHLFQIEDVGPILDIETYIVPVNLTYYPIRAKENLLSRLAEKYVDNLSERMLEEIMIEGTMLLSGVDVDMRFGEPIRVRQYIKNPRIQKDINDASPINFDDPISSKRMMRVSAQKIMERYMSRIYTMTTVNHDHIFATLLKYLPDNQIDEQDLRRRGYLVAILKPGKEEELYRHHGLDKNQINLLTDDRYQKYRNFYSLAVEKKIIIENERAVQKDSDFTDQTAFHQVRINNPVSVIANEIEPISFYQEALMTIARYPKIRIKHLVVNHLMEKAMFDFQRDYAKFAIPGESKDEKVGMPIFLKGKSMETGVLLIHGYMAAPMEVSGLAEYLSHIGYRVYAPRLKGHGTSPNDLATRNYMEWVESVEEGYALLSNNCKKVVVGGFSTGAGLALDLCSRVTDLSGVFAISPPLKLQDFSARFVPAVNLWNWLMDRVSFETAKKEFVINNPENPHINYTRNPVSGILELARLMDSIEGKLAGITIPALVVQSNRDPVVNPDGSRRIFQLLGSEEKEYLVVNLKRHGIILGPGCERVYRAVGDFLERIRSVTDSQGEGWTAPQGS
ncbi:MAG: alpha/beta fold hydrolase [Desulfobacteraceae bacterium]|nr:MAG: alpha/beta fold hydrolase [Desulfobacteraceae bacterium]